MYKSRNWCKNICCKQTRCKKDRPVLSGFNNGQNILRYTLIISVIYIMYVQYHGRNVQDVVFNLESDITFNIINNSLPKKIEILAAVKRVGSLLVSVRVYLKKCSALSVLQQHLYIDRNCTSTFYKNKIASNLSKFSKKLF